MADQQDRFRKQLREQGQMQAFRNRRQEFQDEGLSPSQSWNKAALEFGYVPSQSSRKNPPVPTEPPAVYAKMREERCEYIVRRLENMPLGSCADQLPEPVRFTLRNLHRIGDAQDITTWTIDPADAPSVEAWNMLLHVAQNDNTRKSFMDIVLREFLATSRKTGGGAETEGAAECDESEVQRIMARYRIPADLTDASPIAP